MNREKRLSSHRGESMRMLSQDRGSIGDLWHLTAWSGVRQQRWRNGGQTTSYLSADWQAKTARETPTPNQAPTVRPHPLEQRIEVAGIHALRREICPLGACESVSPWLRPCAAAAAQIDVYLRVDRASEAA
jgi:hypothetical protein